MYVWYIEVYVQALSRSIGGLHHAPAHDQHCIAHIVRYLPIYIKGPPTNKDVLLHGLANRTIFLCIVLLYSSIDNANQNQPHLRYFFLTTEIFHISSSHKSVAILPPPAPLYCRRYVPSRS